MTPRNKIINTFESQTIFLTGATGFLGKVLLEKLLRECEDLRRIYILVRPKKGKKLEERYQEIFEQPCFAPLKSKNTNVNEKVFLIGGDCQQPFLGLSNDDLERLKTETNFVFHLAANVRFDQSLKEAALNVQATRDLLEISKEMPNLKAFVFVSTAYSNCVHPRIKEEIYEPPISCKLLLSLVKECDDDVLENITPRLLGKWPNTYIYTKSISESLVADAIEEFPTTIVRPGIIMNSVEEPVGGWVDNLYGPIGIMVGAAYGVVRCFRGRASCVANIVPVDYVCNCVLAATWKTVTEKSAKTRVYNYIRPINRFITWGEFTDLSYMNYWAHGPNIMIWYNTFTMRENQLWHDVCTFVLHTIPAYLIDAILWCLRKPRIAVKGYQKIDQVLALVSYFSSKTWTFDEDDVTNLWKEMDEEDRRLFPFRNEKLEWKDYLHICAKGMQLFIVKDVTPYNFRKRVKLSALLILNYAVILLFWYLVYKFIMLLLSMFL